MSSIQLSSSDGKLRNNSVRLYIKLQSSTLL